MAIEPSGRRIVYTNQVPYETDVLATNDYIMSAVSALAQTLLGFGISEATTVRGLACTPISPPGMSVVVGPGVMYSFEDYDANDFGVIPADTDPNHMLYKQAFNWDPVTLSLTAPSTPGDSIIYLIEAIFDTVDVDDVSRPYFNSADPTVPIFLNNYDTRIDKIIFVARQGVPGITPTPPSPTAGYTGLYYVTIANGQTSIVTGDITKVSTVEGQPFITEGLTQKASNTDVSTNYVTKGQLQQNAVNYVAATGTANAIVASPTPAYSAYTPGTGIKVKITTTNTNAVVTLNVSGQAAVAIKKNTESGLVNLDPNDLVADSIQEFVYDGTFWQWSNADGQSVVASWNGSTAPVAVSAGTLISIIAGAIAFTGTSQLLQPGMYGYFAMASAPTGWLHCDGSAVSRTTYANLFAAIGTLYGAGDGSTTFNLPPSARLTLVGSGGASTGILGNTVGSTGGSETHSLTAGENGPHSHTPIVGGILTAGSGTNNTTAGGTIGSSGLNNSGNGDPHNIMQPSMVGYLCIKT